LGEEEIILDVFKKLRDRFSSLKLVIATRDISRAENILSLIRGHTLKGALRSRLREDRALYDVLVLDTLGELNRIYGIATVAFVGGSLVPVGGHNLLEPATFGVPVLFGPHTHNFVSMSENLLRTGGGIRVVNGDELFKILEELIQNPEKREAMGACAMDFVKANRGAISRVMEHIKKRIPLHDQD
jgi:3-deoxy-D-manno-octulosonic-acid transferase